MSDKNVGQRIRKLREANSYTRDAFAEKVDISSKFLYEIETGKKGFTVEILSKISKALCVSNDYILGGRENGKVPEKVVDILECFTPEQMEHVQDILKLIQEMSARQGSVKGECLCVGAGAWIADAPALITIGRPEKYDSVC